MIKGNGIRYALLCVLLLGLPVASAMATSSADAFVVTGKFDWTFAGSANAAQAVTIGGFSSQENGEADLLSATLAKEPSGWIPVWFITLSSEQGLLSASAAPVRLGPFSFTDGTAYQTVLAFNPSSGQLAVAVREHASGRTIYQSAHQTLAYDGKAYAVAAASVEVSQFPWFEPVDAVWDMGTRAPSGSFVRADRVEPGTPLWVRVAAQTDGTGIFQVAVDDGTHRRVLASSDARSGETLIPLAADALTLGTSSVRLSYVEDSTVQWEDSRSIVVGRISGFVDSLRLDRNTDQIRGTLRLSTDSFLYGLQIELIAELDAMTWDERKEIYVASAAGTLPDVRGALRNTVYLQPGTTNVPVSFPVPEDPGLWKLRFNLHVSPEVAVEWKDAAVTFATTTPDRLTELQGDRLPVPKDESRVRICTYNILGFQGYPEAEAAQVLGGPNDPRRIEHFTNVFRQLDCDIIGIQEGGSAAMIQDVGRSLDAHVAVYPSATIYLGGLLSRYPILESRSFNNYRTTGSEPFSRFAGASLVDLDGTPTWVVNLHAYPHTQEMRVREAAVLGEQVDALLQLSPHVIVLGDFNSRPGEVIHQALTERRFVNALEISSKNGVPSIDHIYVSPALRPSIQVGWIVRDPGFYLNGTEGPGIWVHSDHVPTVLEITLPTES